MARSTMLVVIAFVSAVACSGADMVNDQATSTSTSEIPASPTSIAVVPPPDSIPEAPAPVSGPAFHELGSPLAPEELESPLRVFLAGEFVNRDRFNEQERVVADCMAEKGWTYHALDSGSPVSPGTVGAVLDLFRSEGYGLSTRVMLGVGAPEARAVVGANEAYFGSLSSAERQQYLLDLDGGVSDEDASPAPGSCRGIAAAVTETPRDVVGIQEILRRSENDTFAHPEVQQGWRDWSACMLDKGYDFEYSAGAHESVVQLWLDTDGQEVERVQIYELRLASADYECRLVTWLPVQIRLEYEIVQQIVDAFPEYAHLAP